MHHQVTPIHEGERRIMLSMTYCTDPRAQWWQAASRRIKDTARNQGAVDLTRTFRRGASRSSSARPAYAARQRLFITADDEHLLNPQLGYDGIQLLHLRRRRHLVIVLIVLVTSAFGRSPRSLCPSTM